MRIRWLDVSSIASISTPHYLYIQETTKDATQWTPSNTYLRIAPYSTLQRRKIEEE